MGGGKATQVMGRDAQAPPLLVPYQVLAVRREAAQLSRLRRVHILDLQEAAGGARCLVGRGARTQNLRPSPSGPAQGASAGAGQDTGAGALPPIPARTD
jgi:hypothetical protein